MDTNDTTNPTARRSTKCPDTPSECNLVIDDDYDENTPKKVKRAKAIRNVEEPLNIICSWDQCEKLFSESQNFISHVEEHAFETESIDDMYVCSFESCEYITKLYEAFVRHVVYHSYHERLKNIGINVVERLKLPKCISFDHYEIGEIGMNECKWGRCTLVCNTIHEFFNHVKDHTRTKHKYCAKGEFNKCEWLGCNLKFTSLYKLIDHLRSHTSEKMIACPICGNMYSSKTRFADHRKRQMPMEMHSYQCSECSKLFPTERLLRDHMRSHINHYKCNMCDMTCSRPSMLALHVRFRHMTERPFKCHLCKFAAVTKYNLEAHLPTHCAEGIYTCEYCEFRCRSIKGLETHLQREHLQENVRLYECHCCQKRFPRGGKLTMHLIKVHDFNWPSGHSRFRYKQEADGFFRLQTVRYESLEVTQEMMTHKPPVMDDSKYVVSIVSQVSGRMPSFVLTVEKLPEDAASESASEVDVDTSNIVSGEIGQDEDE